MTESVSCAIFGSGVSKNHKRWDSLTKRHPFGGTKKLTNSGPSKDRRTEKSRPDDELNLIGVSADQIQFIIRSFSENLSQKTDDPKQHKTAKPSRKLYLDHEPKQPRTIRAMTLLWLLFIRN